MAGCVRFRCARPMQLTAINSAEAILGFLPDPRLTRRLATNGVTGDGCCETLQLEFRSRLEPASGFQSPT